MKKMKNCFISLFIVLGVMFLLLYMCSYAPFGNNSFAIMDANIQYMDFFQYMKNVFEGTNSIKYSFSYTLGGTAIGLLSYYLFSPINLLIIFFSRNSMHSFFNIMVALKISICAFTFSYYLGERFNYKIKSTYNILLSISFALMQYNLTQASNVMWLDGVYMLPLIALGIYKLINKKQMIFLSISVGLSIIFNWYTGGINCIFSAFWFLVEYIIHMEKCTEKDKKQIFINFVKVSLLYILSMLIGIMLSAFIFFPTVLVQRNGRGAAFHWDKLNFEFKGNMFLAINHYCMGSISNYNWLSIFCGSMPIIGVLGYFTNKNTNYKNKIIFGIILLISLMFCYWQPLFFLFSLFLDAASYWFRYSYIVNFAFIFIAAQYFKDIREQKQDLKLILGTLIFVYLLFLLNNLNQIYSNQYVYITIFFIILNLVLFIASKKSKSNERNKIEDIVLVLCVTTELFVNGCIMMDMLKYTSVDDYNDYVSNQTKLINEIKSKDNGLYRISQTKNRDRDLNGLGAYYNESLAYNYMSNVGYTSSPDKSQIDFLDRLGYKKQEDRINAVNTSVIAADSLLGVKYVISDFDIKGLFKLQEFMSYDGKSVYLNPYVLPMAFKYKNSVIENKNRFENEFEYINQLYSEIYGEKIDLYKKIEFNKSSTASGKKVIYEIDVPKGNSALYGKVDYSYSYPKTLNVDNVYTTGYDCWLAPGVFYIPTDGKEKIYVEVISDKQISLEQSEIFYMLDLDKLKEVTNKIKQQEVRQIYFKNDKVKCNVNANEGEKLFLSIPNSEGWKIKRNDKIIDAEEFGDCLITIPLEKGENEIVLEYRVPGLEIGIIITVVGIVLIFLIRYKQKKEQIY